MFSESTCDLVVVKFGTDTLSRSLIEKYAAGLARQHERSKLIVVTSGAVAEGRARVQELGRNHEDYSLPVLASIGNSAIMNTWGESFGAHNIVTGSVLVTHHEMGEGLEGGALKATLRSMLDTGVVPILNENDTLSDIELMKLLTGGDNDGLAARVALEMGAKVLRIYSANGGLYDDNKQLIPLVNSANIDQVYEMLERRASAAVSGNGRGGMLSKMKACYDLFVKNSRIPGSHAEIMQPNEDMSGLLVTRVRL